MINPVAQAAALAPAILAMKEEMDRTRCLPAHLAKALCEAQLYRLCIPRIYGGLEADPLLVIETLEALAEADASAGWCVMIGATTGVLSAYLDPQAAGVIFQDPSLILAGVYAPSGQAHVEADGYRVSGRWKWNSGGQTATWLCGGCVMYEDGAPRMLTDKLPDHRILFFPAAQASFADTWHTSGLRGSGSGEMFVDNLFVPRSHAVSMISDRPLFQSPLYAFPLFGLLAAGIAAVASGNARAALREFAELTATRRGPSGRTQADRPAVQIAFADAAARLRAARALLEQETRAAIREAEADSAIKLEQRARLRLAATHMTRTSADVVRTLQDLAGGSGVFLAEPLNRRLADAQAMTAHIMVAPATYELTGRVLLGSEAASAEL